MTKTDRLLQAAFWGVFAVVGVALFRLAWVTDTDTALSFDALLQARRLTDHEFFDVKGSALPGRAVIFLLVMFNGLFESIFWRFPTLFEYHAGMVAVSLATILVWRWFFTRLLHAAIGNLVGVTMALDFIFLRESSQIASDVLTSFAIALALTLLGFSLEKERYKKPFRVFLGVVAVGIAALALSKPLSFHWESARSFFHHLEIAFGKAFWALGAGAVLFVVVAGSYRKRWTKPLVSWRQYSLLAVSTVSILLVFSSISSYAMAPTLLALVWWAAISVSRLNEAPWLRVGWVVPWVLALWYPALNSRKEIGESFSRVNLVDVWERSEFWAFVGGKSARGKKCQKLVGCEFRLGKMDFAKPQYRYLAGVDAEINRCSLPVFDLTELRKSFGPPSADTCFVLPGEHYAEGSALGVRVEHTLGTELSDADAARWDAAVSGDSGDLVTCESQVNGKVCYQARTFFQPLPPELRLGLLGAGKEIAQYPASNAYIE